MKQLSPFLMAFFVLLLFIVLPLDAENLKPFVMPSARASGFGGIHAAQGDDFSAIFSNPASFTGISRQFSASELTISIYGPVIEMLDMGLNRSGDISSLVDSVDFAVGFDIGGPVAIGVVSDGFGIGFFNRTAADVVTVLNSLEYYFVSRAWEEVLLVAGYSFRVLDRSSHSFDIGFLGKGFYRMLVDLNAETGDLGTMVDDALESHFGVGIDLGIKYCFDNTFTLALVGYDAFSPALVTKYEQFTDYGSGGTLSYGNVKPRLALGVLYNLKIEFLERYFSDFMLMADCRDFIDLFIKDRHPLLNFSLGMEITLLKALKLRAGLADFLPSGGFGIDMKYMKLDVAVRGKQLGTAPGEKTVFAFDVGCLFRY